MNGGPRIGVLALQGAFREHARALRAVGADAAGVLIAHDDRVNVDHGERTAVASGLD